MTDLDTLTRAEIAISDALIGPDSLRDDVEDILQNALKSGTLRIDLEEDVDFPDNPRCRQAYVTRITPDPITVRVPWAALGGRRPVFGPRDDEYTVEATIHGIRLQWGIMQWSVDDLGVVAWCQFAEEVSRTKNKERVRA